MPPIPLTIEGSWEEIRAQADKFAGRRLRVIVIPEVGGDPPPFYEIASVEEWCLAFREWAEGHPRGEPPLSDEAVSRDMIYEGRG